MDSIYDENEDSVMERIENQKIGEIIKVIAWLTIASAVASIIPLIGSIATIVLAIIAIVYYFKLKYYNNNVGKSLVLRFVNLGVSILIVLISFVVAFVTVMSGGSESIVLAFGIIAGLISGIIALFADFYLITGYSELVGRVNNNMRDKWISFRTIYIIVSVITMILSILSVTTDGAMAILFKIAYSIPTLVMAIILMVYTFKTGKELAG